MKRVVFVGLLLVPWLTVAQSPNPPASTATTGARTGTISGRVLGEDGAPVVFVTVAAYAIAAGPVAPRSVLTDAEGNFSLRDLASGSYRLNASAPGYVSSNDPSDTTNVYHLGDTATLNLVKGGVITGRVTTGTGEPAVAVQISALRVRDADGKAVPQLSGGRPAFSDDNGVYRIYGLRAGSYLVVTNGPGIFFSGLATAYDGDVPVYYPSSTRDTASEVQVATSSVNSGIDLRYRSEPGHVISGKVSGVVEPSASNFIPSVSLSLRQVATGLQVASGSTLGQAGAAVFEVRGIPDGDYEISASRFDRTNAAVSPWRRVQVRGTDVTGVDLVLAPLASVAGQVVLDAALPAVPAGVSAGGNAEQKCTPKRQAFPEEVLLRLQRDEGKPGEILSESFTSAESAADSKGSFVLSNLQAGRYRMLFTLPSDAWYAKQITIGTVPATPVPAKPAPTTPAQATPAPATPGRRAATAPNASTSMAQTFALKSGEHLSGVTVTLATGAASIRGQVSSERGKAMPRLRVHLIPADASAAENVLRYAEMLARADGTFQFKHLAPGKYWLVTRPLADDESSERPTRPLAWDATERAKLRREAEAAKQEVELSACQGLADFKLPFTAAGRTR